MATSHDSPHRHYLKEWRLAKGWQQSDLARESGISASVISRYETGDRHMKFEVMLTFMSALGITPPQFFSPPGAPIQITITGNETPEQQRAIIDAVERFWQKADPE
jgi:transcriptional regulator with XRE-family HTH domain